MSFLEHAKHKVAEVVGHAEELIGGAVGDDAMKVHGEAVEDVAEGEEAKLEHLGKDGADA